MIPSHIRKINRPQLENWEFPQDNSAASTLQQLWKEFSRIYSNVPSQLLDRRELSDFAELLLDEVSRDSWAYLRVLLDDRLGIRGVAANSFFTAILSVIFGLFSMNNRPERLECVMAALVHDTGMLFVPEAIRNHQGRVNDEERRIIEAHPNKSHELCLSWGFSENICRVAWEHHEQYNGLGYPRGLSQEQISEISVLISMAVQFVGMVSQRTYRNSLLGYQALKQILLDQKEKFHPISVKKFLGVFGLTPPGSVVLLNDGSIARVLEANPRNLMKPRLRLLIDTQGNDYPQDTGPILDLEKLRLILVRPVNLFDLQSLGEEIKE